MSIVPFVDLQLQHRGLDAEITQAVRMVLRDADFILGRAVAEFEAAFARYCGVAHCVGVASGTDALLLALRAIGVGSGDEVLVPANAFIATAEAVIHAGARPRFVDVLPDTYTIDPAGIRRAIGPRVRAVIAVHQYGHPADMVPILDLARAHGLSVLEDAAQAHGAVYRGRRVGSIGHVAAFSFYPTKNLGACGDGGAVLTNDPAIAQAVGKLRDHGGATKYEHDLVGYTSRLDTVQAAILLVKLPFLDQWNGLRRAHARRYHDLLVQTAGVITPAEAAGVTHVFHLYAVRVPGGIRDALRSHLADRGIQTGIHYPRAAPLVPALTNLGHREGEFPIAEGLASDELSLPMFPDLSDEQARAVGEAIETFMASA